MLDNFACFRAHEADRSIFHDRTPKTYGELLFSRFIRIIETMEHESEGGVSILIIESLSFSKPAWFHVSLAFPGS